MDKYVFISIHVCIYVYMHIGMRDANMTFRDMGLEFARGLTAAAQLSTAHLRHPRAVPVGPDAPRARSVAALLENALRSALPACERGAALALGQLAASQRAVDATVGTVLVVLLVCVNMRIRARARTHTHTHAHARTRARAHTHTHTHTGWDRARGVAPPAFGAGAGGDAREPTAAVLSPSHDRRVPRCGGTAARGGAQAPRPLRCCSP